MFSGDGVTVAPPAGFVVLRGLTINGQGGTNGVRVQTGQVHLESVVISGLSVGILVEGGSSVRVSGVSVRATGEGMRVLPTTGAVSVHVRDSEFSNTSLIGMRISPSGAGNSALVTIERTSLTKSTGYGIYSLPNTGGTAAIVVTQSVLSEHGIAGIAIEGAGGTAWVRESAVTRNGTGLRQLGGGVLNACGGNLLVANTTPTSGTIGTGNCLDVAAGTVTSVATGTGLTGGPITASGTIGLASTQLLPPVACGTDQFPQWNGSAWTCAALASLPAPASSVTDETSFGQPSAVGVSSKYARGDHTHGTPTLPSLAGDVTGAVGSNNVVGLRGVPISATAPGSGQVLGYDGSMWTPRTPTAAPAITGWAGIAAALPANMPGLAFSGPTVALPVTAGSRLTGSASVPMATGAGTTNVTLGLCYQVGAGPLTLFAGAASVQATTVTTTPSMYSTHGSVGTLPAGLYTVGFCAKNTGAVNDVTNVDHVNGWAMVTGS